MINIKFDIWDGLNFSPINKNRPILTTYVLESKKTLPAVLICPGGGYAYTSPREAEPIALKFNDAGFNAFVLDYSVAPYRHPQPLYDLARALTILRENSNNWNIDNDNIAVCGFSAGGHLAASIGVFWNKEILKNIAGINTKLIKPNKLILAYPVISAGEYAHRGSFDNLLGKEHSNELLELLSLELQIDKETPESFVWHTLEDDAVPMENSLFFIQKLRKFKIPFEFHIYPYGGHGLSLATAITAEYEGHKNKHVSGWMDQCISWLNQSKQSTP